jgi:hypothetical protein
MDAALRTLVGAVRRRAPDLVDEWEATAWVESFGWTDGRVRASFGLADTRALGRYVYELSPPVARPQRVTGGRKRQTALAIAAGAYSRTLIYALPWLVMFAVEGLWPDAFDTQPEMAGPISVAVMLSLIATGGFVQAIARKGSFYLGMQQVIMARHVGWLLCRAGVASTLTVAAAGLIAATYFDIFGSAAARLMALFYFVMLSALWLACAMLSLQAPRWRVPTVFVAAGVVFALVKVNFNGTALTAQTAALVVAVIAAGILCWDAFRAAATRDTRTERIVLPRMPVLLHSLLPHFVYGVAYFTFLFADRLSAGSALPAQSGLPFGIAVDYKRGIDLAFLVFLVVAGAVECGNLLLMRFWRDQAEHPSTGEQLARELARRRTRALGAVVVLFVAGATIAAVVAAHVQFLTPEGHVVFLAGCAGYALFAGALLDGLTLFSLNRPAAVLRALLPALTVNLITGYVLSHVAGAEFAVVGLVVGAGVFAFGTRRGVRDALRRPDFAYGWA